MPIVTDKNIGYNVIEERERTVKTNVLIKLQNFERKVRSDETLVFESA